MERTYRVPIVADGRRYVLLCPARRAGDAAARVQGDHVTGVSRTYATDGAGRVEVDWGRVAALEIGPVTLAHHRADTPRQFDERLVAATAALDEPGTATGLAAVAELVALADEWEDRQQLCIDVLCGYVRLPGDPEVRAAIMRAVGDRLRPDAAAPWWDRDFDLTGAVLDGLDLSDARLTGGSMLFDEAHFRAGAVSFAGVRAGTGLSFDRARFTGGAVDFTGATLTGVSFLQATFAVPALCFDGASFTAGWSIFEWATFQECAVSFDHATFAGDAGVSFHRAEFTGATVSFTRADLDVANVLSGGRFSGGALSFDRTSVGGHGFVLQRVDLSGVEVSFDSVRFAGRLVLNDLLLTGARVALRDCDFADGVFISHVTAADSAVTFAGCRFTGGQVTLYGLRPADPWLSFEGAHFDGGRVRFDGPDGTGVRADPAALGVSGLPAEFTPGT